MEGGALLIRPAHGRKAPPLILIADDMKDVADFMTLALRSAGYRVIKGYNGEWALQSALRLNPQLAILNNLMPYRNGIDVAEKLRQDPRTAKMKIIITSASEKTGPAALKKGADAFLSVPFQLPRLRETVKKLLAGP